jgi:energy-coupling factor transporter ATP-binding protein EcfA2
MGTTDATLLVVSHDRRLLEKVCDSLWVVDDGLAVPFDGGYHAWRTAVADGWTVKEAAESEARRMHGGHAAPNGRKTGTAVVGQALRVAARSGGGVATSEGAVAASAAPVAKAARPVRPKLSKDAYRRRKLQLEDELANLTQRKGGLEAALQDPAVHGNFLELRRVSGELAGVEQALAAAEEAWLEMEESAP